MSKTKQEQTAAFKGRPDAFAHLGHGADTIRRAADDAGRAWAEGDLESVAAILSQIATDCQTLAEQARLSECQIASWVQTPPPALENSEG